MNKKALIVAGGDYYLPSGQFDYIIAADKGFKYCQLQKIEPDLIVGDFDSYQGSIETEVEVQRYKIEKDDTDTMIAIKNALAKGYKDITICSCFGGRFDHTIANIQSGKYIAENGGIAHLVDTNTFIDIFPSQKVSYPKLAGYSFSVFALSEAVTGLSIKGTKYCAENITLTSGFPLGVSNDIKDEAIINAESGIIMIVQSKY